MFRVSRIACRPSGMKFFLHQKLIGTILYDTQINFYTILLIVTVISIENRQFFAAKSYSHIKRLFSLVEQRDKEQRLIT